MFIYYLNTGYSKVLVIRPPIGPAKRGLNSQVVLIAKHLRGCNGDTQSKPCKQPQVSKFKSTMIINSRITYHIFMLCASLYDQ